MKKFIITALIAISTLAGQAQENSDANNNPGWLWEISGNGLKQKSYLFGTCHGEGHSFTKEEVFSLTGLQKAFGETEILFNETDSNPERIDTAAMKKFWNQINEFCYNPGPEYMMQEGVDFRTLYDSDVHFKTVDKFLANGMKDQEYWKKTPGYWIARICIYLFYSTRMAKTVDGILCEEALNQGKETGGLEELKDIDGNLMSMFTDMKGIDTLSMKEQADTLYRAIRDITNGTTSRKLQALYKAYISNDTCQVAKHIAEYPEIYRGKDNSHEKEMLDGRNAAWIPVIIKNIPEKTCMIAVGCRHLMGTESLINMLRREGYTVEPVK